MDFAYFESLSEEDAREHLQGFLATEKVAIDAMTPVAAQIGITMNYSLASLPAVLKWILRSLVIIRVPVPDNEPEWIRQFHKDGLIDFPVESRYLILRAAYYLGECFVRSNGSLLWTVGSPDTAEKNMPVVAGFRHQIEMAPVMVCENIYRGILGDGEPESVIDGVVETWMGFISTGGR